jgi:hypothetical protein
MDEKITAFALRRILQEWKALPKEAPPWGVWITQHAPILETITDGVTSVSPIERAWFLSTKGLEQRNAWEFFRMMVIQGEQPWCSKAFKEKSAIRSGTKMHEIGLAAFAQYRDSRNLYLETQWGGLYGAGWCIRFTDEFGEFESKRLWIS